MPPDRDEWQMDSEGNLTPPSDLTPDTDEFGRDDPASIERERRRLEREQRRRKGGEAKPPKEKGGITGGFRRVRKRRQEAPPEPVAAPPPAEAAPPTAQQPAPTAQEPSPPTAQQPAARSDRPAPQPVEPAAASERERLRSRLARGGGASRPPRGRRRAAGSNGGNFRRRRFAALALALVGILVVWFLVAFFQPFAGDGAGDGDVTVEIPEGASASDIAQILDDNGVVSSGRLFEWRLKLAGKSGDIQADTYSLASGMSYGAAIDALTSPAGPEGPITVSIPEGYDRQQIADLVLPEGVSSADYLKLTETAPKYFDPKRYGATGDSLEGFLFPATYELPANEAQRVPNLIKQQLEAFEEKIAQVDMSYAKKKNLTPYDVVIIASMVNKEVQLKEENDDVAAVIYNRLSQGIPLGIDATTRYETGNYTEPITQATLDENTPYNTRLNAGLTPTPIGNPGLAAMKAAARPAAVNYTFFVVKPGTCGEHSFTASEAEFEKLAAEYQAALEAQGGSPDTCPE